jgi:hypothetical protein
MFGLQLQLQLQLDLVTTPSVELPSTLRLPVDLQQQLQVHNTLSALPMRTIHLAKLILAGVSLEDDHQKLRAILGVNPRF